MLIYDETPREEPALPPWSPNWRLWRLVSAATVLGIAGLVAGGLGGAALLLVAFTAACRAVDAALPYGEGLREWRQ